MLRISYEARFGVVILCMSLFSASGCALARNAKWHDPKTINRIGISRSVGIEYEYVQTIDDREKIDEIVAYLNRYQQGWNVCFVASPSGELRVDFSTESDDRHDWFTVVICPKDKGCEIGMNIGDKFCYREISQREKEELLSLLEVDPSMFADGEMRSIMQNIP